MNFGICRLCHNNRKLLRRSHIIPEFNYDVLYDDKNFLRRLLFDIDKGVKHIGKIAKGEYEGDILCSECDSEIIQLYEDYTARLIYAKRPLPSVDQVNCINYVNHEGQEFSICHNVNYGKIKLYILSILWRASISSRPFFENIKLTNEEEEQLRTAIHSGQLGEVSDFPILTFSWLNDPEAKKDVILQPKRYKETNGHRYCFPIRGIVFNIYTNRNDIPQPLEEFLLQEKVLPILHLQRGEYLKFVKKYNGLE
jgi:hypothetical protein